MALTRGKHIVAEIGGVRCTIIESGVSADRADFLKDLLTHNKYEVKTEKEKGKDGSPLETIVIGITDIVFNPMIAVYQLKLSRQDGHVVRPAYWNQWPDQWDIPYWQVQR